MNFAGLIPQFIRFAGIGFLNTAVDYAVFNIIASYLNVYRGQGVGYITAVSFTVAVLHSYYWNKHWAFGHSDGGGFWRSAGQFVAAAALGAGVVALILFGSGQKYAPLYYFFMLAVLIVGEILLWKFFHLQGNPLASKSGSEILLFLFVSVIGIAINFRIVSVGTARIDPLFGLNQELWTNLIKIGATCIALVWNFIGYKVFVFKR